MTSVPDDSVIPPWTRTLSGQPTENALAPQVCKLWVITMRRIKTLLVTLLLACAPAYAASFGDLPSIDKLPKDYAPVDEVIPSLGQPFAYKRDGKVPMREFYPGAPVYYVYKGKIIGTLIFLDKRDFDRGLFFDDIVFPGWLPPIHHLNIEQHASGTPGIGPSVSIHAYFLPSKELDKIRF